MADDKITAILKQLHEMQEYSADTLVPLNNLENPTESFLYQGMLTPGYEAEFIKDPSKKTEDITDADKIKRFDPYQNFAPPEVRGISDPELAIELYRKNLLTRKPPSTIDNEMAGRPRYENVFADQGPQIQMNEGGTVMTPDEYQASNVNYYEPFTLIDVQQAPEVEEEEDKPEEVRPNILTPVSERGAPNVFGQIPIYGSGEQISTEDPYEYIRNFDNQEKTDLSGKGFSRYLEQAGGVPTTVASVATGLPIAALAYGAGQLARKQHRKNAESITSYGGNAGSMFKFQGQTVSRAPGSKVFTGNLGGLSHGDMYRVDEIRKGFIPGTMQLVAGIGSETAARTGQGGAENGLGGVASMEGAIMDAFGTVHTGQRDEGGLSMATAGQSQRLREQEFRDMAALAKIDISGLKGADFVNAAVAFKQHVDGVMRSDPSHGGFFHKTSNLSAAQNASALENRRNTAIDFLKNKYGITTAPTTTDDGSAPPPPAPAPAATSNDGYPSVPGGSDISGGTTPGFGPGRSGPGPRTSEREDRASDIAGSGGPPGGGGSLGYGSTYSSGGGRSARDMDMRASGGRIGMQSGGVAAQPAGFVGGPPENFTEKQTVADDRPMSVPEGTFVINAAAVEFAGSDDIKKMLSDAYGKMQKKVDKSIRVAKIPTEDEIDVAVSRGEVIVPPEIAKIIGYDRLEKINNRGKKEVTRRQKKAGGGLLAGKKFASGGEIYEDRIIMEEVRRKMEALLESLPDDVRVTSRYFEDDYPATQEFYQEFARLNDADPDQAIFTLRPFAAGDELVNAPQTPTLLNLFALAEEIAHLEDKKHAIPEPTTSQIIRADRRTGLDEEFGTDAFMRKQYGQYEEGGYESLEEFTPEDIEGYKAVFGYDPTTKRNVFDYPEYYLNERQYAEEMRAKKFAFDVVFGSMPEKGIEDTKIGKSIQFTKDSYGTEFARYILQTASPTIQKGIFAKYPELRERYFDDKGRFINRKIMPDDDFRMAMDAENRAMSERTLKEFEASPDDRGFLDKFLGIPRKSTYIGGYGREVFSDPQAPASFSDGGKVPKTLPKPSPVRQQKAARQEAERLADVELRADLEEFIRDDQLARLGWDLYTSGELQLLGIPTPFDYTRVTKGEGEDARETVRDEVAYTYAGSYYPTPDRATAPAFPFEKDGARVKVRSSRYPSTAVREYLDKVGGTYSEETPIAQYFAEPMYIVKRNRTDPERYMADRASVMLTLAHELRHAALNHLTYEYGAPEMTVGGEERLMDYFDQIGRKQASKNNALVLAKSPYISVAERGESAVNLTIYKKEAKLYNELASEVLKLRGVPLRAKPEEKGWLQKTIDTLFN